MTNCEYSPQCNGCSNWGTPYSQQMSSKLKNLQNLLKEKQILIENDIEFVSCGEMGLRHRVDFTIEYSETLKQHVYGFYDQQKKLIQINSCLQLSSELQKIYTEFIEFKFYFAATPVRKGSVRLRVGPEGLKGCWLDFSNLDVKYLLDDQKVLNQLLDKGYIVEIGQKGKQLIRENGLLKLSEPVAYHWMKTFDRDKKEMLLKCLISDFTQPSWTSAQAIINQVLAWTSKKDIKSVLEFGSGIGQFSLSFLKSGHSVEVFEIDESSLTQLNSNAKLHQLDKNLSSHLGDFHKKKIPEFKKHDIAFVNPSRSGLRGFNNELLNANCESLIYVSCFPETMTEDLLKLSQAYRVCNITIIDQFPQTKHYETCVLLEKLH